MSEYEEALRQITQTALCCYSKDDYEYSLIKQHNKLITKLIEKEKPKKPIIKVTWDTSYSCPHCDFKECRINDENEQGYGGNYETPKHCQNCGGALDWSKFHKKMLDFDYEVEVRIIREHKYFDFIDNEEKTQRLRWSMYQ